MVRLSKAQRKALLKVWKLNSGGLSYRQFRKQVQPFLGDTCVLVPWCGMWLGIEDNGYTHS